MRSVSDRYIDIFKDDNQKTKKISESLSTEEAFETVSHISDLSSKNIANMWKNGQKVCRTKYVMEAMGENYPTPILEISLVIDAIVNNLDELLDESLPKDKKSLHIFDLSKDIGYISSSNKLNSEQKEMVGTFFRNKIPIVGGGEFYYTELIQGSPDDFTLWKKYYDSRIIDIDIFMELALNELGYKSEDTIRAARDFRAVNLISKDIRDIEDDVENGIKTPFTIAHQIDSNPKEYAKKIAQEYIDDLNKFKIKEPVLEYTRKNFSKMCEEELKQ